MAVKIPKQRRVRKDASKYEEGIFGWKRGGLLAWIQFFDEETHHIIYEPSVDDIIKATDEYHIDATRIFKGINEKGPDIMGFVIDVQQYRKSGVASSSDG